MLTRRQVILTLATLTGGAAAYTAASVHRGASRYDEAVRNIWQRTPENSLNNLSGGVLAVNRELVRYASLAASSHNTQCWKFRIDDRLISVLPDRSRRCPAVDPDDHHMFVSLGCATENLIQAAQAFGKHGEVRFDAVGDIVKVALEPSKVISSPLFDAIAKRQCTRTEYDGRKVSNEDLKTLEAAGSGQGVHVLMLTEPAKVEKVLEYVVQGNTAQMGACFAKWRALLTIGADIPSQGCIEANAQTLARYAALCQEAGLVPMVEPDVLMVGVTSVAFWLHAGSS